MGIRLKGMIEPKVRIYDLAIDVYKDQVIELTPTQFNTSEDTLQMVDGQLLTVVYDPVTPPIVDPSLEDVDRRTFMIRNGVILERHLSDALKIMIQGSGYFWTQDPKFTDDGSGNVSFGDGAIVFGNVTYSLAAGSIGPATANSYLVGMLSPSTLELTVKFETIPYSILANEIILGSYDFAAKELYVPKGVSYEAENASFDPTSTIFSATNVQALGAELNGLLQGTVNPTMFKMLNAGGIVVDVGADYLTLDANSGTPWTGFSGNIQLRVPSTGAINLVVWDSAPIQVFYSTNAYTDVQSKGNVNIRAGEYGGTSGTVQISSGSNGGDIRLYGNNSAGETEVNRSGSGSLVMGPTTFSGAPGLRLSGLNNALYLGGAGAVLNPASVGAGQVEIGQSGTEWGAIYQRATGAIIQYAGPTGAPTSQLTHNSTGLIHQVTVGADQSQLVVNPTYVALTSNAATGSATFGLSAASLMFNPIQMVLSGYGSNLQFVAAGVTLDSPSLDIVLGNTGGSRVVNLDLHAGTRVFLDTNDGSGNFSQLTVGQGAFQLQATKTGGTAIFTLDSVGTLLTSDGPITVTAGATSVASFGGYGKVIGLGSGLLEIDPDGDPVRFTDGTLQIPYDGALIGQGSTTDAIALKYNFTAVVAPGVNDDDTQGYSVGSRWYDLVLQHEHVCLDATTGAAVWKQTT